MLVFEFAHSDISYVKDKTVLDEINLYWKHLRCSIVLCIFFFCLDISFSLEPQSFSQNKR